MKKVIFLLLSSLLCCLVVKGQTTSQEQGLSAFLIDSNALLYSHPIGDKTILSIDNSNNDFFQISLIKKSHKRYFVRIEKMSEKDSYAWYGWLSRSSVGITFKSQEISLYKRCKKSSNTRKLTIPLGTTNAYVLNYKDNGWMKISFYLNGSHLTGWLPPEFQCSNYFTSCCGD